MKLARRMSSMLAALLLAFVCASVHGDRVVNAPCNSGFRGFESGHVVRAARSVVWSPRTTLTKHHFWWRCAGGHDAPRHTTNGSVCKVCVVAMQLHGAPGAVAMTCVLCVCALCSVHPPVLQSRAASGHRRHRGESAVAVHTRRCVTAACCEQGRTPGSYAWFVSCDLEGYITDGENIVEGTLMLTRMSSIGINPLGSQWTSDAGPGPAVLELDYVRS